MKPYWQNLDHLNTSFSLGRSFGGCCFRHILRVGRTFTDNMSLIEPLDSAMPPGYGCSEEEGSETAIGFQVDLHSPNDAIRRSVVIQMMTHSRLY